MPAKDEELPSTVERSPDKVKRTYEKTLDSAHETYDSEERAHRAAWASVKHVAEKKGDHWELKDEKGSSDEPFETAGGIDANKSKDELYADAQDAGIEGRADMTKEELVEELQKHNERETARARREKD